MTNFRKISFWASKHKWPARFSIIISFLIMNGLGIYSGLLLNELNIVFTAWFLILSLLVFSIAWLTYPKIRSGTYVNRKISDSVMIMSTFLMFMYFGNRQVTPFNPSILYGANSNILSLPKDSTGKYKSPGEFKKSLYDQSGKPLKWKERKKLLKQQVKAIKKDRSLSDGGKVGLIILCVLLAVILAYGVAALSCSLSCSGSEGAAVVVAVLGFAGILLLTIFLIRSIVRKSKKEKPKQTEDQLPSTSSQQQ